MAIRTLASGSVHDGLAGIAHSEEGRGLNGVKLLLGERVLAVIFRDT